MNGEHKEKKSNNKLLSHTYNNYKLSDLQSIKFYNLYNEQESHQKSQIDLQQEQQNISPYKRLGRRRSTLTTIPTIPSTIEQYEDSSQLYNYSQKRILNTLITIQLPKYDKLLYVSNVAVDEMNPQFQIQLPSIPPHIHKFLLNLWVLNTSKWILLCQYKLNLDQVQQINYSIDDDSFEYFKNNSICLELNNKWYTFSNMILPNQIILIDPNKSSSHFTRSIPSYTFDQIRSINNLHKSIKELNTSKYKLKKQISKYIKDIDDSNLNTLPILISQLQNKCNVLSKDIELIKSKIESINSKLHQTKQETTDTTKFIENFIKIEEMVTDKIEIYNYEIETIKQNRDLMKEEIRHRLKKDIKVITDIFPIIDSPTQNSSASIPSSNFEILGFQFPANYKDLKDICYYNSQTLTNSYYQPHFENDSELHNFQINQINTCISFIIKLLEILSRTTLTPLTHKIEYINFKYYIVDDKSINYPILGKTSTTKPYKFLLEYDPKDETNERILTGNKKFIIMNQEYEYGLKLLNINLKNLIDYIKQDIYDVPYKDLNNLPFDCHDNLLWNLKYLELLITA
ncbi:hypothetical protein KGF54_001967 [Candida jiufengensis]|uniref:uncharacterized protein n=1 Tax=Candida jiufengensis TaxID=497108 RepID=UPI002224C1BA|nr:uncharacterized protein KGF54_001967 [Candida jiufengensis]KAI5954192.1 hypothetical protein KGF54_001967 [Candida jiufengensis]